ncbi:uncharacterized protein LOC116167335 [Photinus pyralis]|nr:uncharacterized protein LOC116167335 [Photinus pyralis]XP_031338536.1 uncharacterized protein LOC116167335 [Photinus pyralis]
MDLTVNAIPQPHFAKEQSQPIDLTVNNPAQPSTSGAMPKRKRAAPCVNNPQTSTENTLLTGCGTTTRYQVLSEGETVVKKFNLSAKRITIKFNEVTDNELALEWLKKSLTELIEYITKGRAADDRIGMLMSNDEFPDKPLAFSFRRVDQLSPEVMIKMMEKVLQSNRSFFSSDALRIDVSLITLPAGRGRQWMTGCSFKEFCLKKRGIISIKNHDTLCLARALVTVIAFKTKAANLRLFESGHPLQRQKALELCAAASVDLSNGGTIDHIRQFQDYTIVVYNHRMGKTGYFEGPRSPQRKVLNLLFEQEHYNVITSLTSAFTCGYFCELCRMRMNGRREHKDCKYICPCCHNNPPCSKVNAEVKCDNCNHDFRGQECFQLHKDQGLCDSLKRCRSCLASIWKGTKAHKCGFKKMHYVPS